MNEKEKAVLYVLLENPALLEKVSVDPKIFRGQSLDIFNELMRQYCASQSFSWEEAADKIRINGRPIKISQFHDMFDGCYHFDISKLESTLKKIEAEGLSKEILILIKKQLEYELKTGMLDDSIAEKIDKMYKQRAALNDNEHLLADYNSVKSKDIEWLWTGRIPIGMIALIAGHPGTGKSFFTTWLAAKRSRGERLPGSASTIKPCSTLLISAEDDPESTIKPRLEANDADMSKIVFFKEPLKFSLDSIRPLEKALDKNPDIRIIIIDPLTAFLGTKVDYFKDPDVRLKLIPLKELAQQRKLSILGVVHFNKKEDSELITRIGGSMAFAGVARSVLGVSYDSRETEEDSQDTRLLSSLKMNLDRRPDTLAFKINSNLKIDFDPKPVNIDADTLFSRESRERKQKQNINDIWLINYLEENPKATSREILKAAGEEAISKTSLYRSKAKLEIQEILTITETGYGKEHKSFWELKPKSGNVDRTE